MRKPVFWVIGLALLITACSTTETYRVAGNSFAHGDRNIAVIIWKVRKERMPMEHAFPPTIKQTYYPFFYSRKNGVLKFEGYCDPIKYDGPFQPLDYEKLERLQSVTSIEKSCNVKGVKLVSDADAGRPTGGQNLNGNMSLSANVKIPETGQWKRISIRFDNPPKSSWW